MAVHTPSSYSRQQRNQQGRIAVADVNRGAVGHVAREWLPPLHRHLPASVHAVDSPMARIVRNAAAVVRIARPRIEWGGQCAPPVCRPTSRTSVQRTVSSPLPSRGSPNTNPVTSSASARRINSATGGRVAPARRTMCPAGDAIVPVGSLTASPTRLVAIIDRHPASSHYPSAILRKNSVLLRVRDICLSKKSIASASGISARN